MNYKFFLGSAVIAVSCAFLAPLNGQENAIRTKNQHQQTIQEICKDIEGQNQIKVLCEENKRLNQEIDELKNPSNAVDVMPEAVPVLKNAKKDDLLAILCIFGGFAVFVSFLQHYASLADR